MTFKEYYKIYLSFHQHPGNRLMHLIGNVVTIEYIIICLGLGWYWWLLAAPFVVYIFAWPGHWWIEKNSPAGKGHRLKAKACDILMCSRLLLGLPLELDEDEPEKSKDMG